MVLKTLIVVKTRYGVSKIWPQKDMHNVHESRKTDDLLLDKFDISLFAALQNNAHATNQEVGERIHLSASQVSRRIQRLEGLG